MRLERFYIKLGVLVSSSFVLQTCYFASGARNVPFQIYAVAGVCVGLLFVPAYTDDTQKDALCAPVPPQGMSFLMARQSAVICFTSVQQQTRMLLPSTNISSTIFPIFPVKVPVEMMCVCAVQQPPQHCLPFSQQKLYPLCFLAW